MHYNIANFQRTSKDILLTYRDNTPYLIKSNVDKGFLYQCAAPLSSDHNDLVLNAEVFVPMLYKMALARGNTEQLIRWIGRDNLTQLPREGLGEDQVFRVTGPSEFIPGMTSFGKNILLDFNNQISEAGFYNLLLGQDVKKVLAYNFDRTESDPTILSASDLQNRLKNANINIVSKDDQKQLSSLVSEKDKGIQLWKWFIIAALLFLLLEIAFIRLLKN